MREPRHDPPAPPAGQPVAGPLPGRSVGRANTILLGLNALLFAGHLAAWAWQSGKFATLEVVARKLVAPGMEQRSAAVPAAPPRRAATPEPAAAPAASPAASPAVSPVGSSGPAAAVVAEVTLEEGTAAWSPEDDGEVAGEPESGVAYTVHVGSFRSAANARADAGRLADHGFEARVAPVDLGSKGRWFRVYVGRFGTKAEARATCTAVTALPDWPFGLVLQIPDEDAEVGTTAPVEPAAEEAVGAPAAEVEPRAADAAIRYYEFGLAQERRGRLADAAESFTRALEAQPEHHQARNHLVTMQLAQGRILEAAAEMDRLDAALAGDPRFLFNRGLLAYHRKDWLEAHVALVQVLARDPGDLQARLLLGNVFEALGDAERALLEYRDATRTAPDDPAALYQLARALDAAGRRDEAVAAYEQFLARAAGEDPWDRVLEAVKQRLGWLRRS
jgi:tetratricopeptide (TPR) repeat protein